MKNLQAMLLADFYKLSHRLQYPDKTETVYSTWTPRASKMESINEVVVFGIQGFIQEWLIEFFDENFFGQDIGFVVEDYERVVGAALGGDVDVSHIKALHALGYLPLHIKALPEGSVVPLRCPMLTIYNTDPRFWWLTNFVETLISCNIWQPSTVATIARKYRQLLEGYAEATTGDKSFVPFQGHDFSMRGMAGVEAAARAGAGHLAAGFVGTDTIPAISYLEEFYGADVTKELVGTSVPATEHSVACSHQNDMAYFDHILNLYPKGIVSIVSDTWDLWDVVTNILPKYKERILARDGKLVIRPDSGDPVLIVCGDPEAPEGTPERKGVIQLLWETFGGTETAKGYRQLDSHIGCIYGDSITLDRAGRICEGLKAKGFASTNIVFGIGSFTYQYNTRDTFGFALKSTLCVVDGEERHIFKDPKTDDGTKKSQKGAVGVYQQQAGYPFDWIDQLTLEEAANSELKTVFKDGYDYNFTTLAEIRQRITEGL